MENNIKLGVRLFSFRNMYSLEESFKKIKDLGANAFDITASQTVPEYPWPSEKYIEDFKELYHKYGLKFISYDGNIDKGIRSDRQLNDREMFHYALNDIMYAKKFGAKISRIQWHLPPNVLEKLAPYCELLEIKAGIEIHSPLKPSSPIIQEYVEMLERVKSPWIGLIPDFGAFASKHNRRIAENAVKDGTKQEIVDYTVQAMYEGKSVFDICEAIKPMGATPKDLHFVSYIYHYGCGEPDFEGLKRIMPLCIHAHAKFYDFEENGEDANIPVRELLKIFYDAHYDGYITSEYEGHMECDEDPAYMVGKQLTLYRKVLKELESK